MPVFLGSGLRSFESASLERVRIEKIELREVDAGTGPRFRVRRGMKQRRVGYSPPSN
jgi:hypothetical protein